MSGRSFGFRTTSQPNHPGLTGVTLNQAYHAAKDLAQSYRSQVKQMRWNGTRGVGRKWTTINEQGEVIGEIEVTEDKL